MPLDLLSCHTAHLNPSQPASWQYSRSCHWSSDHILALLWQGEAALRFESASIIWGKKLYLILSLGTQHTQRLGIRALGSVVAPTHSVGDAAVFERLSSCLHTDLGSSSLGLGYQAILTRVLGGAEVQKPVELTCQGHRSLQVGPCQAAGPGMDGVQHTRHGSLSI